MSKQPATFLRGLFEAHLHVLDLERSMRFYENVLGLELGLHERERRAAFYWVGDGQSTMLGLWEAPPWITDGSSNVIRMQHIAFAVALEDMDNVIQNTKEKGVELRNLFGEVT